MKSNSKCTLKTLLAKGLAVVMIAMTVITWIPDTAQAAAKPVLSKTAQTILAGKKYTLKVNHKIKGSVYQWATGNKKIATVDKQGLVKGINKGVVSITCKVKTPKKHTYNLTCKVTIVTPATSFAIKNKVSYLTVGQKYNLNRTLKPASSNDITTWTSSDSSIAAPDGKGKFTALKAGTVTITGTTLSGKKDSVTIKVVDKDGTVKNQTELDELLASPISVITIKTTDTVNLVIKEGDYSAKKLVVDAPNAEITNYGKFASIEIKQIKSDTWIEKAIGNLLTVYSNAKVEIGEGASASIEVTAEGVTLKVINNGKVEKLEVLKKADIEVSGTSKEEVPVVVNVPDVKITSSVPLNLTCEKKVELTLLKGAEATKVQATTTDAVPTIKGDVTITVTVGTGSTATQVTVVGTPINTTNPGSTGNTGSNGDNPTPTNPTYTFNTAIANIKSVSYKNESGESVPISDTLLDFVKGLLTSDSSASLWSVIPNNTTYPVNGYTVTITGTVGNATKTVSISGGQFNGKSYSVTVAGRSVTIVSSTNSVTITKSTDNKSFSLSTAYTLQSAENSQNLASLCNILDTVTVEYNGKLFTVDFPELVTIKKYIDFRFAKAIVWAGITTEETRTYDNQQIKITPTADSTTKTVTFMSGQFTGRSYTISLTDSTLSITNSAKVTATVTKATDIISIALN